MPPALINCQGPPLPAQSFNDSFTGYPLLSVRTVEMVRDTGIIHFTVLFDIHCFSSILLDDSIHNTEEADEEDVGRR